MAPVTRRRAKAAQNSQEIADSTGASPESSILSPAHETNTTIEVPVAATDLEKKESTVDGESPEETTTKTGSKGPKGSKEKKKKKANPKGQKLAVRVRDEDTADSHHVSVEAHTIDVEPENNGSASIADSQDSDVVEEQKASTPSAMLSKQLEEEASQRLKRDHKHTKLSKNAPTPTPKAKGSHVVFGDDDDVDTYVAAAAKKQTAATNAKEASEDDEESDDEAPEAVSTQVATKAAMKSEREAAEAAEKHAADLKRKRQQKDNMLKQQAEKRKRTQLSRREKRGAEESDEESFKIEKAARSEGRPKLDRHNLPDELPAEFLTDSESEDDGKRKPKKIKFDDAVQLLKKEGRRPQDEVMGSTVYRVLADQGDKSQAPRMHQNARRLKEQLLRRGRATGPTGKSKGFLKKK